MSRILNFSIFQEANINLNTLADIRENTLRGNILVDIINNEQVISVDGKNVIIYQMLDEEGNWIAAKDCVKYFTDPSGGWDIDKAGQYFKQRGRFKKVFKSLDGLTFSLNQIKKTIEFGSRGAGKKIKEFETLQCIFLGIKQAYPNVNLNDSNLPTFYKKYISMTKESGQSLVKTPESVDINLELLDEFSSDFNWVYTFYKIPNRLWSQQYQYLDRNQLYYIYHVGCKESDSPYVNLNRQFNSFSKKEGFGEINFTKWCPADVYLISVNERDEVNRRINDCKSIYDLTSLVDEIFDSKILLPLSLKKLGEGTSFKIIVNKEVDKELPDFKITSFGIGSDLKGIGSKVNTFSEWKYRDNKNVDTKQRTLNLDSSNTAKKVDIDGEVEGSTSRHGKISFKAIKRIIDSSNLENIQVLNSVEELKKLTVEELEQMVINLISKTKSEINDKLLVVRPIMRGSDISKNESKLISRIQSLQVVLSLGQIHKIDQGLADSIITKIMRYALSIQTDKFNTPRYLRVI